MSWRNVEPLDCPQYEPLSSITRSVHLRDAMVSFGKQKLSSHKIQTRNAKVNAKVLWFAPTKPMNQNNMYGNVSFTLDWSMALEQFGPYLYYIDQKETLDIIYSRVLLTNKCYSHMTPANTSDSRMPLRNIAGKYHVVTASDGVTHVVEIGIEADARKGKRLYANCKIQANDHSSANTKQYPGGPFSPCICHRYNYFDKVCSSPYPAHQTRAILNKRCPTMLRDAPSLDYDQSAVAQISTFLTEVLQVTDEDDDDENVYEDGEFIANYDDHDNDDEHGIVPRATSRGGSSHHGGGISTPSYGASGLGSTYGSGVHRLTGDSSSNGGRYANARASGFQKTATKPEQDEEWSTGSKVALVAGGLVLFAGLAAAFTADTVKDDEKKKTKNWWE